MVDRRIISEKVDMTLLLMASRIWKNLSELSSDVLPEIIKPGANSLKP